MSIYEKLFPYQKNIVDKFKDKSSYGLFLDMGLGKTPISLSLAEVNNCDKVIIITINSKAQETENISGSWLNWAKKSSMNYNFYDKKKLFNKKIKVSFDDTPGLLLLNYESLYSRDQNRRSNVELKKEIQDFIKSCKNHNVAIIIDESHKIKDSSSIQSKAINQIKKLINLQANKLYSYLLTGTPFTQGFIDLYAQLKFLGCEMTKETFKDKFCVMEQIPGMPSWQQRIVSYKNIEGLYDLVHKYAITIKSNEVIDLPDQIFVEHVLPISNEFNLLTHEKLPSKMINDEMDKRGLEDYKVENVKKLINNPFYRNLAYPDIKWMAETVAVLWMRARQISIGFQGNMDDCEFYNKDRLEQLKNFLINNEDNYLIFYNYTAELVEIYDICEELGYNIDVYSGEIKSEIFYEQYCKLSKEEKLTSKKNVILANFQSGSTGKNWQEYNKCIIFSLPLYKDFEQGIKRIHRTGQKDTCIYHLFYQNNWLDKSMKQALDEKSNYTKEMFEEDLERIEEIKNM